MHLFSEIGLTHIIMRQKDYWGSLNISVMILRAFTKMHLCLAI